MNSKLLAAGVAATVLLSSAAHACPSQSERAKAAAVTACAESATMQRGSMTGPYAFALFQTAYDRCMLGKGYKVRR